MISTKFLRIRSILKKQGACVDSLAVPASEFYKQGGVDRYWDYKNRVKNILEGISEKDKITISDEDIQEMESLNPDYYYSYYVQGLYYKRKTGL